MHSILRTLLIFVLLAAAGFAADTPIVAEWRKQAEAGDATAQIWFGHAFNNGVGVAKDATEAVMWYLKAAEQGHNGAKYILSTLSGEQVARVKAARQQEARWQEARVQAAEAATEAYRALSQNSWFPGGRAP